MQRLIFRVKSKEQLEAVKNSGLADCVIYDHNMSGLTTESDAWEKYTSLPDEMRENNLALTEKIVKNALENGTGLLVKTIDELAMLAEVDFKGKIIADSFLYAYNSEAIGFYKTIFPDILFLAPDELTDDEHKMLSKRSGTDFIYKIYGHQLLMVTRQCFRKNYLGCTKAKRDGKNDAAQVKYRILSEKTAMYYDEKGNAFLVLNDCSQCSNLIYYADATSMLDKINEVDSDMLLVDLTVENKAETQGVLTCMKSAMNNKKADLKKKTVRGYHFKGID